ncbi:MAG: twin-arginine translocase subunit TatC [Myxococcota bacterium]
MDTQPHSLMHHIHDLRCFLWRSLWGVVACTLLCALLSHRLLTMLTYPLQSVLNSGDRLVVLSVYEYLFTQLKVAILGGLLLATPWILYQLWQFIAPGLYRHEKRLCVAFTTASSLCALVGAVAGYFWGLPLVLSTLTGLLPPHIQGAYSLESLFEFAAHTVLVCAALCETPVVVFALVATRAVRVATLRQYRRHVVVVAFILGAVLTPPDPLTQILVAFPFVVLYEIGLLSARLLLPDVDETNKLTKALFKNRGER